MSAESPHCIACPCGSSVTVTEAEAGVTMQCRCGRTIVAPSLREMRRMASKDEPEMTPDFIVEAMLAAGRLPEGSKCVLCNAETQHCLCCMTTCELTHVTESKPHWILVPFIGLLGYLLLRDLTMVKGEWGRDKVFPLPLRICEGCSQSLTSAEKIKVAMRHVPIYDDLLDQYPRATVVLLPQKGHI